MVCVKITVTIVQKNPLQMAEVVKIYCAESHEKTTTTKHEKLSLDFYYQTQMKDNYNILK